MAADDAGEPPPSSTVGGTVGAEFPGYRVVREIGRGRAGVVYEAEQLSLGRRVALKHLTGGADEAARERFRREASVAASLVHANVLPVFEIGESAEGPFYAMEFVEPARGGAPRPARQVAQVGVQAARALAYAHARGVRHRDVRAANLLVDARGKAWLTGFGDSTAAKQDGRSPARVDGADDVAALVEMLGDWLTPSGDARAESLAALLSREPVAAGELAAALERWLAEEADARESRRRTGAHWLGWGVAGVVSLAALAAWRSGDDADSPVADTASAREDAAVMALWDAPPDDLVVGGGDRELYHQTIRAAAAAIEANNHRQATRLLLETEPEFRDWEWRHLRLRADPRTRPGAVRSFDVSDGLVSGIAFDAPGRRLAALTHDGRIFLHDTATGERLGEIRPRTPTPEDDVARSTHHLQFVDADRLLVSRSWEWLWFWRVADGALVDRRIVEPRPGYETDQPTEVKPLDERGDAPPLWDVASNGPRPTNWREIERFDALKQLSFSPDERFVVSRGIESVETLVVWDAATMAPIARLPGHSLEIQQVAYHPEGDRFLSASFDRTVRVWDAETHECVRVLSTPTPLECLAVHPGGRRMVTGEASGSVKLWDLETYEVILEVGDLGQWSQRAAFSRDGRRLAVSGSHGTLHLWNSWERRPHD